MKKYIAHILPKTQQIWTDENTLVDFEDETKWEAVAASLVNFINLYQPNVLIEHEVNGGSVGRAEKAWADEKGVWCIISVDPSVAPAGMRWVSPRIGWNHIDVEGTRWPAALLEVSLVSVPRFLVGQTDLQETEMSESKIRYTTSSRVTEMSELVESSPNPTQEAVMDPNMIEAIKKIVAEMLLASKPEEASVEVEVAPVEEMAEADVAVAEADNAEEETLPSLDSAMAAPESVEDPEAFVARIPEAELRQCMSAYLRQAASNKREAVMSQIKQDLSARQMDESLVDEYMKVRQVSEKAYTSLMSAVQPVKATSAVRALSKGTSTTIGKMDRHSATAEALRISKATGESYSTVFKRLTA